MMDWCTSNGLIINFQKSSFVGFSLFGEKSDYKFFNTICSEVSSPTRVCKISWYLHGQISFLVHSCGPLCYNLLRKSVSISSLVSYYYVCINSHLKYGMECPFLQKYCSIATTYSSQNLSAMQKRIWRICKPVETWISIRHPYLSNKLHIFHIDQ